MFKKTLREKYAAPVCAANVGLGIMYSGSSNAHCETMKNKF